MTEFSSLGELSL